MKNRQPHQQGRGYTREYRKVQVTALLADAHCGMTVAQIAKALGMSVSHHLRKIVNEVVADGYADATESIMVNGSKRVYYLGLLFFDIRTNPDYEWLHWHMLMTSRSYEEYYYDCIAETDEIPF